MKKTAMLENENFKFLIAMQCLGHRNGDFCSLYFCEQFCFFS